MTSRLWRMPALLLAVTLSVTALAQDDDAGPNNDDEFQILSLNAVPRNVLDAARSAAPDVAFQGATSLWMNDKRLYRVSGRLFREAWTVHVFENGEVMRIERDVQDD